jgi:hypothetical protein
MDNSTVGVTIGHVLACSYQFIFTVLGIIEICGLNVLGRVSCIIVLILAFCFDLVETTLVHTLGSKLAKPRRASQALCYWHILINALLTILLAVFFSSQQFELLQEISTLTTSLMPLASMIQMRWLVIMVILVAGWLGEVLVLFTLVLSSV